MRAGANPYHLSLPRIGDNDNLGGEVQTGESLAFSVFFAGLTMASDMAGDNCHSKGVHTNYNGPTNIPPNQGTFTTMEKGGEGY